MVVHSRALKQTTPAFRANLQPYPEPLPDNAGVLCQGQPTTRLMS